MGKKYGMNSDQRNAKEAYMDMYRALETLTRTLFIGICCILELKKTSRPFGSICSDNRGSLECGIERSALVTSIVSRCQFRRCVQRCFLKLFFLKCVSREFFTK